MTRYFPWRWGIAGLLLVSTVAWVTRAQEPKPTAPATPAATDTPAEAADENLSPDEQAVRQAIVQFVELYNARKVDGLLELFATDAVLIGEDGDEVRGHEAIRASFEDEFRDAPESAISLTVESLRSLTPDVLVEEGEVTYFPDGETPSTLSRYTVVHLRRDGRWRIQSSRSHQQDVLSSYGRLRELEWMIGDWVDEGYEDVIETSCRWAENKSFLLQDYQVIREGEVVLKGSQRIGWDPQAKQIRSWIFDSQGGFGEVAWTRVSDGRWIGRARGVTAEGVSAASTRSWEMLNKDHYVVTMTDRLQGDEQLPDLAVTMARKPPKAATPAASGK